MKSEQAHVLRFDDGSQVSYGVPDFPTAEEAADFLEHIRTEIEEGAAEYFGQCCRPVHAQAGGSEDGDSGDKSEDDEDEASGWQGVLGQAVSFAARPSTQTRRLEDRANRLRAQGLEQLQEQEEERLALEQLQEQQRVAQEQQRLAKEREARWQLRPPSRGLSHGR